MNAIKNVFSFSQEKFENPNNYSDSKKERFISYPEINNLDEV